MHLQALLSYAQRPLAQDSAELMFCLQVIKLISQVIADFANGEISQATALFDTGITQQQYLDKSFFKTASLIAASCRSAAVFSGCDEAVKAAMFNYGKHLGLAFQVRVCNCKLLSGPSALHTCTPCGCTSSLLVRADTVWQQRRCSTQGA